MLFELTAGINGGDWYVGVEKKLRLYFVEDEGILELAFFLNPRFNYNRVFSLSNYNC